MKTGNALNQVPTNKKSVLSIYNPSYNYTYVGNALSIPTDKAFLLTGDGVSTGTGLGYSVTVTKNGVDTTYEYTTEVEFSY